MLKIFDDKYDVLVMQSNQTLTTNRNVDLYIVNLTSLKRVAQYNIFKIEAGKLRMELKLFTYFNFIKNFQ